MIRMQRIIITLFILVTLAGCSKKLDEKPSSTLVLPESVQDFENMLDNTEIMNLTTALPQMSADEYYIPTLANYNSLATPVTKTT